MPTIRAKTMSSVVTGLRDSISEFDRVRPGGAIPLRYQRGGPLTILQHADRRALGGDRAKWPVGSGTSGTVTVEPAGARSGWQSNHQRGDYSCVHSSSMRAHTERRRGSRKRSVASTSTLI